MTEAAQPRRSLASQLSELTRHSAIYGIGGLTSRFLAVLMLPLYTSYVSAADYGRIELLMATMAVAVVLIRGGANFGFIRFYFLEQDHDYRRRLIRTVFWTQMGYATAVLAGCILFAPQISTVLGINAAGNPHLQGSGASLVIATAVLLWANVNYAQMTNLFRAEKRSAAFTAATLANIAITVGLTVLFVVVRHQGPIGIIVGNLSGTLIVWGVLLAYRSEQLGLQWDGKLLRSMNKFGLPLMAAALAMWVTNFGDRLMLSKLLHGPYRLTELGQYSLATKIASAMVLLFTAFQIAWPAFAYSIEDEKEAKRAYSFVPDVPPAHRLVGGRRAEPVRAVARALPRAPARLLAGGGGGAGACVRERLLRRIHRRHRRRRPHEAHGLQLDRRARRARSSTSASTSTSSHTGGCSARRGRP